MSSLTGKVALITGASKGIGRAVALRLAQEGASIVINYSRDAAPAEELVKQIGADRALAVQADAGAVPEIEKLVQAAVAKFGKLDVVVANAGIMPLQPLAATTEDTFDRCYALNVKGPYFLAQKAAPHLADGGRIVFISTGMAHNSAAPPPYLLYTSTKGAIEQMTRFLSKDPTLAKRNITVNAVAPGPTATELFFQGKSEQMINGIASMSPFQRLGKPEEIAAVISFVAGPDSSWVSGQVLNANGGSFV